MKIDLAAAKAYGVSASGLVDFLTCRMAHKLYKEGWVQRRTPYPLHYGRVAHEVLEAIHNFERSNSKFDPLKVVRAVCQRIQKKEAGLWIGEEAQAFELICAQLEAVIPAYVKYYAKKKYNWVGVEEWFHTPFSDTFLNGRFDNVFERAGLWLFDTKNKSDIEPEEMGEVITCDFQVNFYILALWLITKKYPRGFIYNILRRPGLKLGKKETLEMYSERIKEHISEKGEEYYFQRYEISVIKSDIIKFKDELETKHLPAYWKWYAENQPTTLFGNPCAGKYGLCRYVPICYADDYSGFHKPKKEKRK